MHILESYALTAGVDIDFPTLNDKFFPLPFEKYIVLHTNSKPIKNYDYFEAVLHLLNPYLEKEGIKVVEIGNGFQPQRGTHSLINQTSLSQSLNVIKNSMLVLGVDSFPLHAAGVYNVPIVGIYSNANYLDCVKPYFGDRSKQILMQCDTEGKRPSFTMDEFPKSINTIKPEEIAASVCKLLNIPFNFPFRTLEIGGAFNRSFIEGIPNQAIDLRPLNTDTIVLRMDEGFNEDGLHEQLKLSKVAIVTDKPIDLNLLKKAKPQITEVIYNLKYDNDPGWVASVQRLGIRVGIFTYLNDQELNKYKESYLDLPIITQKSIEIPEKLKSVNRSNLFVISNRFVLSSGKIYPSIAHLHEHQTIPSFGFFMVPVPINNEIWKENGCFWFLEKLD